MPPVPPRAVADLGHRPLRDLVTDRLRSRIMAGEIAPGARLVERSLADELGVSRIPVREALRTLAHEGFAEDRPRRGMVVREPSADEVDQLLEVRAALETLLCVRLAEQAAGPAADTIAAFLDESLRLAQAALDAGQHQAAVRANGRFHAALMEAGGAALVAQLLRPLAGRLAWLLRQHADPVAMHAEHQRIRDAVLAGDVARVRSLTRAHLAHSRRALDAVRAAR